MRFTVGDQTIVIKCSGINTKYEAEENHFLKTFLDRGQNFNGLKHLADKVTAVTSLTRVFGLLSTTHCLKNKNNTAKINKVKDLALIFFDQCLYHHQDFIFCQKHLQLAFFYILFIHSHPFNDTFIVNGKSHCCNDTFTEVRLTSLVAKNA